MSDLKFTIFTPIGEQINQNVQMVLLPSLDGQIGILKRHMPLIAGLQFGLTVLFDVNNKVTSNFYIDGGCAKVENDHLQIICDYFLDAAECDKEFLKREIKVCESIKKLNFYQNVLDNLTLKKL